MNLSRRQWLTTSFAAGAATAVSGGSAKASEPQIALEKLNAAALDQPVLRLEGLNDPIRIASIELLEADTDAGRYPFVRVRSQDGAEGVSIANGLWVRELAPILRLRVAPYFLGRDARDVESSVDGVYRHASNYKLQSLALWCPVAWVEFAILDLLGRQLDRPVAELLGGALHDQIAVYPASGRRGNAPEDEVEQLAAMLEQTGCDAIKFRLGGRMSNNADSRPGRSEALIRLARRRLGDDVTLYADSNSSYDVPHSIRIGRLMEEYRYGFFEEPCPFDWLEETRQVKQALDIPIAWGEQESSYWAFRWMIAHGGVDVVQPDLHYYGGFVRTARVARMCQAAGLPLSLHLSGGVGYAQMLQFVCAMPNLFAHQEFKGDVRATGGWFDPPIVFRDGRLTVPRAPGFGMTAADDLLKNARPLNAG